MFDNTIPFNPLKSGGLKHRLIPERLTKARKAKRLSQQGLADILSLTRQAISAFELGVRHPDGATLFGIARALEQPLSYFGNDIPEGFGTLSTCFFRAFGSDTKQRNEQCKVLGEWASLTAGFFALNVNFPPLVLPDFSPTSSTNFYSDDEIENAANKVRREWGLGDGPIGNLIALLESKGIFIVRIPIPDDDQVNAFSFWSGKVPFIILGAEKTSAVRVRFDIAHELGHLVLHHGFDDAELENKQTLKKIEAEANRFAGAFLLPPNTYRNEILTTRLDAFVELKRRWKAAISAQIYRCSDLDIFPEQQILNLYKQISARRWKKKEPLDDEIPLENPSLLKKTIELLINNNIFQPDEIVQSINLSEKCIESFCNLPNNWLSSSGKTEVTPILKPSVMIELTKKFQTQ
jgi:Zn-dependent peptidase ImmA (M78 family)/transcriptional regulator with XRE-family HTH domain